MNPLRESFRPVYHGMALALLALIFGALWAAYMATHHESLHGAFEVQEASIKKTAMKHLMQDMNMDSMLLTDAHAAPAGHSHAGTGHDAAVAGGHSHTGSAQHSHSGSLAKDAMQRLLRGHIHFMGIGILAMVTLILVAATSLKACWKNVFGWTFGLGALLYPPAWILMGFRTVALGPEAAEASVLWLFGPAVGLLLGSLIALFAVLALEATGLKQASLFKWAFES